ncbi:MAG: dehydrogenase [Acidobacteria bacterium RIFCSPLOWO2_12_FULL_67_14b]|nr:MAG: dehydrogenase [Acidobacteria bacterium RIFCSPLOWO2_12_FULL_67_14b]
MAPEGEGKTALVTGASSGIGKAFAELLAEKGYGLILTARRRDRLEALAADLATRHGVPTRIVVADLADPEAPARMVAELGGARVDLLVNNAGYGVPGSYTNVAWSEHQRFMQIMVTAVCDLTYRLLPGMVERGWGRIINIASVAGMVPAPAGHTLYGAAKAFVIRFSEALSAENAATGVHVTAVSPGFTYSEFHDVTGTRDKMNRVPAMLWLDATTVAKEGYAAVMAGDAVVVNGRIYRILIWLNGVLPKRLARWVSGSAGRRYRKA